jgi:N-glycosylase/DNA lyase
MNNYNPKSLSNAVAAICPDIQSRAQSASSRPIDERYLWWELSSCILSSQVPYTLAIAAADAIDVKELLLNDQGNYEVLVQRLIEVLTTPLSVEGHSRTYRFPVARASQLAATRNAITSEKHTLRELIDSFEDVLEARVWFVKNVPGVGPKQASMFLRNIGVSYELAILDRHVLNYMSKLGIYSGTNLFISSLKPYLRYEAVLCKHARDLDCPVGLLDWAIWIVMRVANRNMEPVAI